MPFYKDADKRKPKTNYSNKGSWDDEGTHYSDRHRGQAKSAGSSRFGPGAKVVDGGTQRYGRSARPQDRPAQGRYGKPAQDGGFSKDRPAQGRYGKPAQDGGFSKDRPAQGRYGKLVQDGGFSKDRPAQGRYGKPVQDGAFHKERPAQGRYGKPVQDGGFSKERPTQGRYGRPVQDGSFQKVRPQGQRSERPQMDKSIREIVPISREYEHYEYVNAQPQNSEEVIANENLLSGRNPIREALKSGRDIEKLLVAKGELSGSAREIVMLAKEKKIPVQEVERQRLDEITRNHQGMLAFASAYQYAEVSQMLQVAKERNEAPFIIILDGITDPHNLGAIIRTAECAGAHGVIVPQRRSVGLTPAAVKASAGAVEHLKVARVTNLTRTIESLRKEGLWFYAATMDGEAYNTIDFNGGVALVIGGEGDGISRLVLENCDKQVSLPMKGQLDSLNASVAAGVLMYQVMASRAK